MDRREALKTMGALSMIGYFPGSKKEKGEKVILTIEHLGCVTSYPPSDDWNIEPTEKGFILHTYCGRWGEDRFCPMSPRLMFRPAKKGSKFNVSVNVDCFKFNVHWSDGSTQQMYIEKWGSEFGETTSSYFEFKTL